MNGTLGILNVGEVKTVHAKRPWPTDISICRKPINDLRNKIFGRLNVICYLGFSKSALASYWMCICECGSIVAVSQKSIVRSKNPTQSCGCLAAEKATERSWNGCGELSKHYWNGLRNHANERHLEFEISIEYGWNLFEEQNHLCALSGVPLEFGRYRPIKRKAAHHGRPRLGTASLDRKNSSIGYIPGNVQWVHKEINRMKGQLSDKEFIEICTGISMFWRRSTQHPAHRSESGL